MHVLLHICQPAGSQINSFSAREFQFMAEIGFSEACERNKGPILEVLTELFGKSSRILEIGSGTGQHAVYFARALTHLHWQPADTGDYLPGLKARLQYEALCNVSDAIELDVRMSPWPVANDLYDGVFSANTLHYMGEDCVEAFFNGVGKILPPGGMLAIYGPFRYQGKYTSPSNEQFDSYLKASDPVRGIRDFEWINDLAAPQQFTLQADYSMPANNQLLLWCKATNL
ncbi:MAG: DUF938 domain-containing protein [Gammaproteobacteria bacterium]